MPSRPNQFSRSGIARHANRSRMCAGARIAGWLVAAPGFSRHARWTQNILVRLLGKRSARGRTLQAMIPVFAARPSTSVFQTLHVKNVGRGQTTPSAPQTTIVQDASVNNYFATRSPVEVMRDPRVVLVPKVLLAAETVPRGAARNSARSLAWAHERPLRVAIGQRVEDGSGFGQPSSRSSRVVRQQRPQGFGEPVALTSALVTNIGRKHRRIEAAPPTAERARRAFFVAARESEDVVPGRNAGGARRHSFDEPDRQHRPQAQGVVPFDATRMTDEILKQLDRRLVAAKERRGRI
jgi:hypothetical protein